jgi:hypothetical protein
MPGKLTKEEEEDWKRAKEAAKKNKKVKTGSKRYWRLVMHIYQKLRKAHEK